jgi:PleD family two-component response regulator
VTAKTTHLDVYKGFEQGAVDYIKKPFELNHYNDTSTDLYRLNVMKLYSITP